MSFIKPSFLFSIKRNLSSTAVVSAGHWNKDWKPAKFPDTEAEMVASAKKYGLLRKEYVPKPDDGEGTGDYPNIEKISSEARDPFYPWDYPAYRRNYGEIMHPQFHMYTEDRINLQEVHRYPLWTVQLPMFLIVTTVLSLLIIYRTRKPLPLSERELPETGAKHYMYE